MSDVQRLTDLFDLGRPEDVHHEGDPTAREAVAGHTGVRPEQVILTGGVCLALSCVLTWARIRCRGKTVLCPRPHFPAYPGMSNLQGFSVVHYELRRQAGWHPDPRELEELIRTKRPAIILWNTPHNPTGAVFDPELTERVADVAAESGAIVVQDESFTSLTYNAEPHPPTPLRANLVRVGGFSKRFPEMADQRLGYVLADEAMVREFAIIHRLYAVGASVAAQRAATALLSADPAGHLARVREELRQHRDYAVGQIRALPGVEVDIPAAGLFLWVRLPNGTNARQFSYDLRDRTGLWCVYGESFGITDEPWVRLRFGVSRQALERHCAAFCQFASGFSAGIAMDAPSLLPRSAT